MRETTKLCALALLCLAGAVVTAAVARSQPTQDRAPRVAVTQHERQGDGPGRASMDRAAAMIGVTVPLVASEALRGVAHAVDNELRWCIDRAGYGADECEAISRQRHALQGASRLVLAGTLASYAATVAWAELSVGESLMLVASSALAAKLAFDVAYNLRAGNPLRYEGEVAASDRLARAIGEDVVWVATLTIVGGSQALTFRVLR